MARTLVIRLSSLGDVAMTVPVLFSVANRYPDDEFIFLTKSSLLSFYSNLKDKPQNIKVLPVYEKGKHKGIAGLAKLIKEIKKEEIDQVADLHDVLRSKAIDLAFSLQRKKVSVIEKGRKERKALIRKENKDFKQLTTSIERYRKVFEKLGYDASFDFVSLFPTKNKKEEIRIGIAPFAKHQGKIYPSEKIEKLIQLLIADSNKKTVLFGGKEDRLLLEEWVNKYERVESVAGKLSFQDELFLMNDLDVMVSMDSANMHLASLTGTPVVSIWGATHPYAGFYGYNQDPDNAVQLDLSCRPCSIFGNKPCWRKDYACMQGIDPEIIVEKVNTFLSKEVQTS